MRMYTEQSGEHIPYVASIDNFPNDLGNYVMKVLSVNYEQKSPEYIITKWKVTYVHVEQRLKRINITASSIHAAERVLWILF